ncbi:MAG: sigma-70 family RNA polymerase sigma factor [Spirochaetales bacterium]
MSLYSMDHSEPSAEECYFREDELRQLRQFVATLEPRLRKVFQLHFAEGLPSREVSLRLGCSVSEVYRASRRIKGLLGGFLRNRN